MYTEREREIIYIYIYIYITLARTEVYSLGLAGASDAERSPFWSHPPSFLSLGPQGENLTSTLLRLVLLVVVVVVVLHCSLLLLV